MNINILMPIALMMLISIGGNLWQFTKNNGLQKTIGETEQQLSSYINSVNALAKNAQQQIIAQQQLSHRHHKLETALKQREQQISRLKYENNDFREWSATQLPADAQRMLNRPAITSAADYQQWLSDRNAMHAERSQPTEHRRPD